MLSLNTEGVVERLFVSPYSGEPMREVVEAEAVAGCGLREYRYFSGTGYWSGVDHCQVTLIEAEVIERIEEDGRLVIRFGEHRRNIVTRGVRLHQFLGKQFRVGEVVLEFDRPRPPCGHIRQLAGEGLARALYGQRGGIGARIISSGILRIGDPVASLSSFGAYPVQV